MLFLDLHTLLEDIFGSDNEGLENSGTSCRLTTGVYSSWDAASVTRSRLIPLVEAS